MVVTDADIEAVVQEIVDACESMTGLPYDGEPVDQLQHALQCALLARSSGAAPYVVVAALLHDIARAPAVAGIPYDGEREHHGEAGARWLTPRVGARIAWLAESHVPAKRYLVATDPNYRSGLTEVSIRTLAAQGGPMDAGEIEDAEALEDWALAVQVRRWDDLAKDPDAKVPGIEAYRDVLRAAVSETVRS